MTAAMTDTVNARERVEAFLNEWVRRAGNGNLIYGMGMDDEVLELTVSDLRSLLAAAPKAEPVSDPFKLEPLLWSMHILGPDDVYPAPDLATAFKWCEYVNSQLAPRTPDVLCAAIPAPWCGTAEEHANGLPDAIRGWTVPEQPEAPKVEQEPVGLVGSVIKTSCKGAGTCTYVEWGGKPPLPGTAVYTHPAPASDELLEALEPFAKAAKIRLCGEWQDDQRFWNTDAASHLTFGDLRRAESLYDKHKGPQS